MQGDALLPAAHTRPRDRSYWFDVLAGRCFPAVFFSIFMADKLILAWNRAVAIRAEPGQAQPSDYLDLASQMLGLAYFCMLVALYAVRLPRRAGDASPRAVAASFVGTFAVLGVGFLPGGVEARQALSLPAAVVLALGLAYTVWALAHLRRSFSILPEARRLVTGGPYALSRHPLYLGETSAAIGYNLPTVGWPGALLLGVILLAQYVRIGAEESVLRAQFPDRYAEYSRRVPRYLPDPRRLLR
jgi:protein-S-isoprenylcysteine O-methyltransferase Ste14